MDNRGKHGKKAASSRRKVTKGIGFAVVGLVVIFFVASYAIDRYLLAQTFARVPANRIPTIATFDDYYAPALSRQPVEFVLDGKTLRGYVYEKNSAESSAPASEAPADASVDASTAVDAPAPVQAIPTADAPAAAPAQPPAETSASVSAQAQEEAPAQAPVEAEVLVSASAQAEIDPSAQASVQATTTADAPAPVSADAPSTTPVKGLVVFRHGIFSQHQDYLLIIGALAERGWKVFAYDAIGCGLSDGDSTLGFPQSPRDVHRALQYIRESGLAAGLPVVLMGHSWGGYGVAAALNFHDDVKACVTMSGFDDPTAITVESAKAGFGPLAVTQTPTIWFANQLDFGADANLNAVDGINGANIPVLVVHGTGDTVVGYGTTGIIAQRNRITNPQVEYAVMDDSARNGHNSYFNAPETQAYLNELAAQQKQLAAENGAQSFADLPENVQREFFSTVDTKRANTPDPTLIAQIDDFLTRAVAA